MIAPIGPHAGGVRRKTLAARSVLLLIAMTAACTLAGVIGARTRVAWDVTAMREHHLSPWTTALLRGVVGRFDVILAADLRSLDARTLTAVADVTDRFNQWTDDAVPNASGARVDCTVLDVGTADGRARYESLLARLAGDFRTETDSHVSKVSDSVAAASEFLPTLAEIAAELAAAAEIQGDEGHDSKRSLGAAAAAIRAARADVARATDAARAALTAPLPGTLFLPSDEAANGLRATLSSLTRDLGSLAEAIDRLTATGTQSTGWREKAVHARVLIASVRERATSLDDALGMLRPPRILSVARTLRGGRAALVVGPPSGASTGVASINIDALLPQPGSSPTYDVRARAEELIATAVVSLTDARRPILVLVHAAPVRLAPQFRPLRALLEHLSARGIDLAEWPITLDPDLKTAAIDPSGTRPLIFALVPTDVRRPESALWARNLAQTMGRLLEQGRPVLVSVTPSALPGVGEKDPLVEFLAPWGVRVDSGRPLMHERREGKNRIVDPDTTLTCEEDGHVIARAVRGLRARLPWAVPIGPAPRDGSGATFSPLLTVTADPAAWAEADWIDYRSLAPTERAGSPSAPANDSSRDDPVGPWVLGAAIEAPNSSTGRSGRLVVIGSNGWFFDEVAAAAEVVDGRVVARTPANFELAQAAVYWLAGRDELVASGATARVVPVIGPMTSGQMSTLRWILVAGLPLLILLLGAAWRILRG